VETRVDNVDGMFAFQVFPEFVCSRKCFWAKITRELSDVQMGRPLMATNVTFFREAFFAQITRK
jgi:hypothetical protein